MMYIVLPILQDHLKIIRPYDPYTATVCALYFIFGVVCAFFGYRCFKAIMFLYGFIFGSIVVYLICAEEEVLPGTGPGAGIILFCIFLHLRQSPTFHYRTVF